MRSPLTLVIVSLLLAGALAAPAPARADAGRGAVLPALPAKASVTDADKEAARRAYADVESAWTAGDLAAALRHADAAFRAVPNASTAILRATIFAALDRPCDAFGALLVASDLDPTADETATIEAQLAEHGAACDPQMAWLALTVAPPDARVEVGDVAFDGRRTVGLPVGVYDVRVTAPGHLPLSDAIQAYAPEKVTAAYRLEPEPAPVPDGPPAVPVAPPRPTETGPLVVAEAPPADAGGSQVLPWLLVGGGGALVATGVGMHVWAMDAADETNRYASPVEGLTDDERKDRFDQANEDMQLRGTLAYVFYGVGGAAAVTGAVLLILDATSDDADAPVAVLPGALPGGGGGFVVRGGF